MLYSLGIKGTLLLSYLGEKRCSGSILISSPGCNVTGTMQCCDGSWEDVGPAGHKETDGEQERELEVLGFEQILENICNVDTEESSQVLIPLGRGDGWVYWRPKRVLVLQS